MDTIDFNLELEKWKAQIDKTSIARLPDSDFNLNEIKQFYMGITEWEEDNPIWNLIFWLNSFEYQTSKMPFPELGNFREFIFPFYKPFDKEIFNNPEWRLQYLKNFNGNMYIPILNNPYNEPIYICSCKEVMSKPVLLDHGVIHIAFDNLGKMLKSINTCFDEEVYFIISSENGFKYLDIEDFEKEFDIIKKINPTATFWDNDDY